MQLLLILIVFLNKIAYENRKYYKVAFHPFLDMISSGTTASETKSTIFDIQQLNLDSGKQGAVFYIRPNGQAMVNELLVLDGTELISTRKELSISFNCLCIKKMK